MTRDADPSDRVPPVEVSRRIEAPAPRIFAVLANPSNHVVLDGSGMVRGVVSDSVISSVGDVFVTRMFFERLGEYEMNNHVVEFERDRHIGWEPEAGRGHPNEGTTAASWGQRWSYELVPDGPDVTVVTERYDCSRVPAAEQIGMDGGRIWRSAMATTLERLDELSTGRSFSGG